MGYLLRSISTGGTGYRLRTIETQGAASPTLVTDIDGSNVHQTNTVLTVTGANALLVEVAFRSAPLTGTNGSGWRHGLFALTGAEGWTVTVRWPRSNMDRNTQDIPVGWVSSYTTDYETWTQAPSRSLFGGDTGYIECVLGPLPAGTVAIATQPLGRNSDAAAFVSELLTTHSAVASVAASADVNGVFATSPAETDDLSRAVGGNSMYAIKLAWGGATNDGGPKRKLVMWAGIHAAGEATSWISFRAAVRWMLTSNTARAVALRANWDVWLYFNVTPNGIRAGHRRHNPSRSTDPNRDIGIGVLAETSALVSATLSDTGGSADALFDWHGYMGSDGAAFIAGTLSPVPAAVTTFIGIGEPIFGVASPDYSFSTNGTSVKWGHNTFGAKVAFACEVWQRGPTSAENYEFVGEAWVDTLAEADAQGLFWHAAFSAAGESVTSFAGQSVRPAAFAANGQTQAAFAGQAVTQGAFASTGTSETALVGRTVLAATVTAQGIASSAFAGRAVSVSAFSVIGESATAFTGRGLASAAFSAGGTAAVSFNAEVSGYFDAVFSSACTSASAFVGRTIAQATASASGTASVSWVAIVGGYVDAVFQIEGASAVQWRGASVTQSAFSGAGSAVTSFSAQTIRQGAFAAAGSSATAFESRTVISAQWHAVGTAEGAFAGQYVASSAFSALGAASVSFASDVILQDPALLRSVYVRLGRNEPTVRLVRDEPTVRLVRDEPVVRIENQSTTTRA